VQPLPHTKACFACGRQNPLGLRLQLLSDGVKVQTQFTPTPHHAGFKGVVHGGITATLLDEIMAWTCAAVAHRFAYCAELSVRYLRPWPTGQAVVATGELTLNRRRLFEARAEIIHPTEGLLATAQGKYLPISNTELEAFADDFVGDPTTFLTPP